VVTFLFQRKLFAPHHLTVDLENQLTFLAHDNLLDYMILNFGQEDRKELQEHVSLFSFSSIDGQQEESQQANKKEQIYVSTCINSPSIDFVSDSFREYFSEDSKEEVEKSYGQSTVIFSSENVDQQFQEDTANKFLSQGDNQQPEKYFVVHDCFEACDIYGMFQGGQENYSLVSRAEIMKEQPSLLMQPEFCHVIHDPIAIYMESICSEVSCIRDFSMQASCSCKYQLLIDCLLHLLHILWVFLKSYLQKVIFINQMLLWLHWKFHYT
jgi:hypothetical protein